MKVKILFFLPLFIFSNITWAQLQKGNLIIDGGANLQHLSRNGASDFSGFISPRVNYFLSDRVAVGGQLTLASVFGSATNFGLTGNGRLYLTNQNKADWYLHADLGFLNVSSGTILSGNAGIGLDIFLTPSFALETQLSIGFQDAGDAAIQAQNPRVFQLGTGLKFFFNRFPEEVFDSRSEVFKKGTLFLGTTTGNLSITNQPNSNVTNINLRPNIGIFLTNNWLLGGQIGISSVSFSNSNVSSFQLELLPFTRYYFVPEGSKVALFGELGAGYNLFYFNDFLLENNAISGYTLAGGLGANFFLNSSVAFEIKGKYQYLKLEDNFTTSKTLGIDFGLQFFLPKKSK